MGRNNLTVGSHDHHSVVKYYANDVNNIANFVEPTTPTNIITNNTILNQYSIKQGLNIFGKKTRLQHKKSSTSYIISELFIQRSLKTSSMNNKEGACHT